ncbi:MAG: hypothetical protein LUC97_06415 [Clostridiales bacterium]|nr:hypothetical protein [Clostridiales bacterium]
MSDRVNRRLQDIFEKELVMERYLLNGMKQGKTYSERTVYDLWCKFFPEDYKIPNYGKLQMIKGNTPIKFTVNNISQEEYEEIYDRIAYLWETWRKSYRRMKRYIADNNLGYCTKAIKRKRLRQFNKLTKIYNDLYFFVKRDKIKATQPQIATYTVYDRYRTIKNKSYDYLMAYAKKLESKE